MFNFKIIFIYFLIILSSCTQKEDPKIKKTEYYNSYGTVKFGKTKYQGSIDLRSSQDFETFYSSEIDDTKTFGFSQDIFNNIKNKNYVLVTANQNYFIEKDANGQIIKDKKWNLYALIPYSILYKPVFIPYINVNSLTTLSYLLSPDIDNYQKNLITLAQIFGFKINNEPNINDFFISPMPPRSQDGVDNFKLTEIEEKISNMAQDYNLTTRELILRLYLDMTDGKLDGCYTQNNKCFDIYSKDPDTLDTSINELFLTYFKKQFNANYNPSNEVLKLIVTNNQKDTSVETVDVNVPELDTNLFYDKSNFCLKGNLILKDNNEFFIFHENSTQKFQSYFFDSNSLEFFSDKICKQKLENNELKIAGLITNFYFKPKETYHSLNPQFKVTVFKSQKESPPYISSKTIEFKITENIKTQITGSIKNNCDKLTITPVKQLNPKPTNEAQHIATFDYDSSKIILYQDEKCSKKILSQMPVQEGTSPSKIQSISKLNSEIFELNNTIEQTQKEIEKNKSSLNNISQTINLKINFNTSLENFKKKISTYIDETRCIKNNLGSKEINTELIKNLSENLNKTNSNLKLDDLCISAATSDISNDLNSYLSLDKTINIDIPKLKKDYDDITAKITQLESSLTETETALDKTKKEQKDLLDFYENDQRSLKSESYTSIEVKDLEAIFYAKKIIENQNTKIKIILTPKDYLTQKFFPNYTSADLDL